MSCELRGFQKFQQKEMLNTLGITSSEASSGKIPVSKFIQVSKWIQVASIRSKPGGGWVKFEFGCSPSFRKNEFLRCNANALVMASPSFCNMYSRGVGAVYCKSDQRKLSILSPPILLWLFYYSERCGVCGNPSIHDCRVGPICAKWFLVFSRFLAEEEGSC